MIADLVIQGTESKAYQRRRSTHSVKDLFAACDRLVDLEPIPTPVVGTQYLVRRKVEFEDLPSLVSWPGREHADNEIGENAEEKDHEYRDIRDDKHRGYDDQGKSVLPFLLDRGREPLL